MDALDFAGGVVVVLNAMYGCTFEGRHSEVKLTLAQREVLRSIGARIARLREHLERSGPVGESPSEAWAHFQDKGASPPMTLVAALVDCPRWLGRAIR